MDCYNCSLAYLLLIPLSTSSLSITGSLNKKTMKSALAPRIPSRPSLGTIMSPFLPEWRLAAMASLTTIYTQVKESTRYESTVAPKGQGHQQALYIVGPSQCRTRRHQQANEQHAALVTIAGTKRVQRESNTHTGQQES